MENLTRLRSLVYERDKHNAGWGAHDRVAVVYALGHTCRICANNRPPGQWQLHGRNGHLDASNHGDGAGYSEGKGRGYGHGFGFGYNQGWGFGCGFGDANGDYRNSPLRVYGTGYGDGGGDSSGCGDGHDYVVRGGEYGGRLWTT